MKKYILLAIIFILSVTSLKSQTYKYIPDANFRIFLSGSGYPFDASGDSLDISDSLVINTEELFMTESGSGGIATYLNLDGIQYFINLRHLGLYYFRLFFNPRYPVSLKELECRNCSANSIASLPDSLISLDITESDTNLVIPVLPSNLKNLIIDGCFYSSFQALPDSLNYFNCTNNLFHSLPFLNENLKNLIADGNPIDSIFNLPNSLTDLSINNDSVKYIDSIPNNLVNLYCYNNLLSTLPTLPISLNFVDLRYNRITSLPSLQNLVTLICSNNLLTSLPNLPINMERIVVSNNLLDSLPPLPSSLKNLDCSFNYNIRIPNLPSTLENFNCSYDSLTSLPPLPNSLQYLTCNNNQLTSIPNITSPLMFLYCNDNKLTSIPELPNTLYYLHCYNNPSLHCLPFLPSLTYEVKYDSVNITCIPNLVPDAHYIPAIGSKPFCNPYVHSCPSFTAVEGNTYIDANANCTMDSIENKITNVKISLKNGNTLLQQVSSLVTGRYAFNKIPADTYTINIDTLYTPYYLPCISSGYDTLIIDSSNVFFADRNFALKCKPGFDIGTTGIIRTTQIRPANSAKFYLHAGDMANLYGFHCSSIAGKISLNYSGPMHYTGVEIGTLTPDSILPNRLVWNIADFSLLDFNEAIKPNFFVDSSAMIGDYVCFNISVTPSSGDRVPSNNTIYQCFDVRASYDPNIKEVSPSSSVTPTQDWLYYTIHFQNTGNSYAQNIYVWDTIDPNLNLNSIQVMGASHNQFMQVFNNNRSVLFNFININLLDSTTNEPASHGWVQYRIKPNASLAEGTNIRNTASILFDLNAPVITNMVTTNICNTTTTTTQTRNISSGDVVNVGTHTYSESGSYTDILSNINGCDSTVNTIIQIVNGQLDINAINFIVYPNPTINQVFIQLEGMPTDKLNIVDMYGRTIFESDIISNKYQINTENWSNGTYIIQCGSNRAKLVVGH